jgi:hypothetical protein
MLKVLNYQTKKKKSREAENDKADERQLSSCTELSLESGPEYKASSFSVNIMTIVKKVHTRYLSHQISIRSLI